jgi:hypothetical protein
MLNFDGSVKKTGKSKKILATGLKPAIQHPCPVSVIVPLKRRRDEIPFTR